MFQLFRHASEKGLGTAASIYIDHAEGLLKKQYSVDGLTCGGIRHTHDIQQLRHFFDNEVFWLEKMQLSPFIPRLLFVNRAELFFYQEYKAPDLLSVSLSGEPLPEHLSERVLEMYRYFKTQAVFKRNGSLSNMTYYDGELKAFDFKWAMPRPLGLGMERRSYSEWLVKIDSELPGQLLKILD